MSRVQAHGIVLIIVLALLVGVNVWARPSEGKGPRVEMEDWVPLRVESWEGEELDPPDVWREQLPAAHFLVRMYESEDTVVEFLMIESIDPGSFHSPMFCLPGSGYTPEEAGKKKLHNGYVSQAKFNREFDSLVVRYWYLAGDQLTSTLWRHKWNMVMNKMAGIRGPNFSFRVTVRRPGYREAGKAADEFANLALKTIQARVKQEKVASSAKG